MITQIMNAMNTIFQAPQINTPAVQPKAVIENPFASPFILGGTKKRAFDYKNQPVPGGYFAGYYNNKQNIVGKKLFIAV